jgi:hypothetical protein
VPTQRQTYSVSFYTFRRHSTIDHLGKRKAGSVALQARYHEPILKADPVSFEAFKKLGGPKEDVSYEASCG